MRVIYISGSGRSGSTLLERLLHASTDASGLGEFHCMWRVAASQLTCSCGSDSASDPFWQAARSRAGIGPGEVAEARRLEGIVARSGFIARHGFSIARLSEDRSVRRFLEIQFSLFEAVSELTGRKVVIDSSKAGPRSWILACDSRVGFVHLYRNPADAIASWRSRKFDQGLGQDMQRLSVGRAALDWWKVEYFARRLGRQRPVQMMDYHQLCKTPRQTIDQALLAMKLPVTDDAAWLGSHKARPTVNYHSLNGNPDRFDRSAIEVSLRETRWSRFGMRESAMIRGTGMLLSGLFPRPSQQRQAGYRDRKGAVS